MTERQRQTFDLINEFRERHPDATLTQAARATRTVPETYRAAVDSLQRKRNERRVILRRKEHNGNETKTTRP